MTPIVEQGMTWICPQCNKRPWAHAEHCACGAERPAPPPEPEPSDISRPDVRGWPGLWSVDLKDHV